MGRLFLIGTGILLVLGVYAEVGGQGYSIRDRRVIVDRAEEWRNWSFPPDVVEITGEGPVHPRRIRRDIDAVADIAAFGGGILAVGSRPEDAVCVLDGDPETFWEPDLENPIGNWWIEIDLGRLVSADRDHIDVCGGGGSLPPQKAPIPPVPEYASE